MENGESAFIVYKMRNDKRINLSVLESQGKPTIQLTYRTNIGKMRTKLYDISLASKVFRPITDQKYYALKIIIKKSLSFYCREESTFNCCFKSLNEILRRYHKETENEGNINMIQQNPSVETEDESVYMVMCPRDISTEEDEVYMPMHAQNLITPNPGSDSYKNLAFQYDYQVPEFSPHSSALIGGCLNIARRASYDIPSNLDENIIGVLKLKEEICCAGGIEVDIDQKVCKGITVVEIENNLWISDVICQDSVKSALHVGDKIYAVNKYRVTRIVEYIQHSKHGNIQLRIIRLPRAKVFAINNDDMKKSFKRDLILSNPAFILDENQNEKWIITEMNSTNNLNFEILQAKMSPGNVNCVILHQKSFLSLLKPKRKSSLSKILHS